MATTVMRNTDRFYYDTDPETGFFLYGQMTEEERAMDDYDWESDYADMKEWKHFWNEYFDESDDEQTEEFPFPDLSDNIYYKNYQLNWTWKQRFEYQKEIQKERTCLECGIFSSTDCAWSINPSETIETFCCDECDINGMYYNGWGL